MFCFQFDWIRWNGLKNEAKRNSKLYLAEVFFFFFFVCVGFYFSKTCNKIVICATMLFVMLLLFRQQPNWSVSVDSHLLLLLLACFFSAFLRHVICGNRRNGHTSHSYVVIHTLHTLCVRCTYTYVCESVSIWHTCVCVCCCCVCVGACAYGWVSMWESDLFSHIVII